MSSEQLDYEIDLIELFETLWLSKWFIAAITSAFAAISITFALLMPTGFGDPCVFLPLPISKWQPIKS